MKKKVIIDENNRIVMVYDGVVSCNTLKNIEIELSDSQLAKLLEGYTAYYKDDNLVLEGSWITNFKKQDQEKTDALNKINQSLKNPDKLSNHELISIIANLVKH